MAKKDQKTREHYDKLTKSNADSVAIQAGLRRGLTVDSINYLKLQEIFKTYGFPDYDLVGQVGSLEFWLLVQHQDRHPAFQDSVLKAMKVKVDSSKANVTLYAYLLDRVAVNKGELQVYGTQIKINADSTSYEPLPVVDPENLNSRRSNVGLPPIEVYIQQMNKSDKRILKPKESK